MYTGKQFEQDFRQSFQGTHAHRILRLYDTTNGFAGIANPCDFIYYAKPYIAFLELKSVAGKRLPFSNITKNQWDELTVRCAYEGMVGAIVIQFREVQKGYLVPMDILNYLYTQGKKSISIEDCEKYAMPLNLIYKRVRCYLNPDEFMRNFIDYASNRKPLPMEDEQCQN